VIHLGHNRSVEEIVTAALQEDVHGIAVSSYQGGHVEYFKYAIDLLRQRGGEKIRVFGGGGGVIVAEEIADLHAYGVTRIYSPEDGRLMGLQGMIDDMVARADFDLVEGLPSDVKRLAEGDTRLLARIITALHDGRLDEEARDAIHAMAHHRGVVPVLGITGTGGAGKSSLTDEVVRRFRYFSGEPKIAIVAIDPSRRKTGGALLGDRIRMNAIDAPNIYMRSLATREAGTDVPAQITDVVAACKAAGFDLIIVETPGIGQGDAGIVPFVDLSLYVMTPEYGAASQLEKIDMLDFADVVAINKFDRQGARDALRDVAKQMQRMLAIEETTDPPAIAMEILRTSEWVFQVNPKHWSESDGVKGALEGNACPWYSRPGWNGAHCGIFGQFQSGVSNGMRTAPLSSPSASRTSIGTTSVIPTARANS